MGERDFAWSFEPRKRIFGLARLLFEFRRVANGRGGGSANNADRVRSSSCKFRMNNIGILMPVINAHPHLQYGLVILRQKTLDILKHTFLNVLRPAKILPPIQVEYFLSGGAKILILISLTANRCTS